MNLSALIAGLLFRLIGGEHCANSRHTDSRVPINTSGGMNHDYSTLVSAAEARIVSKTARERWSSKTSQLRVLHTIDHAVQYILSNLPNPITSHLNNRSAMHNLLP